MRLKETLEDSPAELERLVLQARADFHASNDEECSDTSDASDKDDTGEELGECTQP